MKKTIEYILNKKSNMLIMSFLRNWNKGNMA